MSKHEVYFDNHSKTNRFPWSIYHQPLLNDLQSFVSQSLNETSKVLVIGPGDFQEFPWLLSTGAEISILDIDPRVIETQKSRYGLKIKNYYSVDNELNGYPGADTFDVVYAKEVIEHVENYDLFLKKLSHILKANGKIWLSTPNYGFFLLPLLEATILELIARKSGFSRRHIHPSRFSKSLLKSAVEKSGLKVNDVRETPLKLALTIKAEKIISG
jgi:2-polyprenyl-3-methyl-5-hydroxy-6-metoxy-1,4-benzoquinol methylase